MHVKVSVLCLLQFGLLCRLSSVWDEVGGLLQCYSTGVLQIRIVFFEACYGKGGQGTVEMYL